MQLLPSRVEILDRLTSSAVKQELPTSVLILCPEGDGGTFFCKALVESLVQRQLTAFLYDVDSTDPEQVLNGLREEALRANGLDHTMTKNNIGSTLDRLKKLFDSQSKFFLGIIDNMDTIVYGMRNTCLTDFLVKLRSLRDSLPLNIGHIVLVSSAQNWKTCLTEYPPLERRFVSYELPPKTVDDLRFLLKAEGFEKSKAERLVSKLNPEDAISKIMMMIDLEGE